MELGVCWDMPGPVGLSWLLSVALLWLRLAQQHPTPPIINTHRYIPICTSALFHTRGRYPEFHFHGHLAFERTEGHN
mgnify:CR=1 FL=1